jgi:Mn2+/Fe2+ NRAMP family transporter
MRRRRDLLRSKVGANGVLRPLTYLRILLVGNDRTVMGKHANGPLARALGWSYFKLICVLSVAAPVTLVVTNSDG